MNLLKLFWNICLFRQGPEDIPASTFLLRLIIVFYLIANGIILLLQSEGQTLLVQLPVQLILVMTFFWGLLYFYHKRERYPQTICAVLGCDIIISLCALPPLVWIITTHSQGLPNFILLGIMAWQLAVMGHILQRAISQPFYFGVGLALVYATLAYKVMEAIHLLIN